MFISKRLAASFLILAMCVPELAFAKTPPEVLKAYKSYNASMQKNDYKSAIKHAKTAWEKAEGALGDHPMTGDLAYNYGYVEKNQGDKSKSIKAFKRSVELAALKETDAVELQLEREVELVSSMDGVTRDTPLGKRIKGALKFANANGLASSVFVGELYVHQANICTRSLHRRMKNPVEQIGTNINRASTEDGIKEGNKKCAKIAQKAVNIFDANSSQTRPAYVANANNYVGYGFETQNVWLAAAMSYQKSRYAIEDVYGRENPLVARTIGRWINARNFLARKGQLEHAESQGLCKCWPFSNESSKVRVSKWVDADFPAKALRRSSGYAIVQMDVNDAGVPENVKIMTSWPEDVYDKASLKAAKGLEFAPKVADEAPDYRKNVTVPYSYFLRQGLDPI